MFVSFSVYSSKLLPKKPYLGGVDEEDGLSETWAFSKKQKKKEREKGRRRRLVLSRNNDKGFKICFCSTARSTFKDQCTYTHTDLVVFAIITVTEQKIFLQCSERERTNATSCFQNEFMHHTRSGNHMAIHRQCSDLVPKKLYTQLRVNLLLRLGKHSVLIWKLSLCSSLCLPIIFLGKWSALNTNVMALKKGQANNFVSKTIRFFVFPWVTTCENKIVSSRETGDLWRFC